MAKTSKRGRNKQNRKNLKAKRISMRNIKSKTKTKFHEKTIFGGKLNQNVKHQELNPVDLKAKFVNDSGELSSTHNAKEFAYNVMKSISRRATKPMSFIGTCAIFCSLTLNRSLSVVSERKRKVQNMVSSSMGNGYIKLKKIVGFVGDTVFPSRQYKRKLDEMSGRLEEVEKELKRLKMDIINLSHSGEISSTTIAAPSLPLLPSLPPPVPPPPPPPPPLCKPPPLLTFQKKLKTGKEINKDEPGAKIGISLKEIIAVKLRKVNLEKNKEKENLPCPHTKFGLKKRDLSPFQKNDDKKHPFITLKDIRKVTLRKTQTNENVIKRSPLGHSKIAFARQNLRKVKNKRSPGGTLFYERKEESFGEGLTPIITRALKKKFQHANPRSPADQSNETNSFLQKTFDRDVSPFSSPFTKIKGIR